MIELTPLDGPAHGKTLHGLYSLHGDRLKLCVQNGNGAEPTDFTTKANSGLRLLILKRKPVNTDKPKENGAGHHKEKVYAWGKAVKGLQAGLAVRPDAKDSYAVGETVTFVVKVRNVSDKPVELRYVAPLPIGDGVDQLVSPSMLDSHNNRVPMSGPIFSGNGGRGIVKKSLAAGEEIEFALPTLTTGDSGRGAARNGKADRHVKPGKYKIAYYVYYVNPDDTMNYLSTGQVAMTVKDGVTK